MRARENLVREVTARGRGDKYQQIFGIGGRRRPTSINQCLDPNTNKNDVDYDPHVVYDVKGQVVRPPYAGGTRFYYYYASDEACRISFPMVFNGFFFSIQYVKVDACETKKEFKFESALPP